MSLIHAPMSLLPVAFPEARFKQVSRHTRQACLLGTAPASLACKAVSSAGYHVLRTFLEALGTTSQAWACFVQHGCLYS